VRTSREGWAGVSRLIIREVLTTVKVILFLDLFHHYMKVTIQIPAQILARVAFLPDSCIWKGMAF
jgi:hypothetical protein